MSPSTVSLLVRKVPLSSQAQARLLMREGSNRARFVAHANQLEYYRAAREAAYLAGLSSKPTPLDAMCVGLYWGEGNKYRSCWGFCNSDPRTVTLLVTWAVRAGQPEGA